MTTDPVSISPDSTMSEVLQAYPGAQRALFARYHVGGCQSCGFSPEETLQDVCRRNENLPVEEVIDHIVATHDQDREILLEPSELGRLLRGADPPRLLDVRTREEHEAVHIPGSRFVDQDLLQEAFASWPKEETLVIYDHEGSRALDAAAYFLGHGFANTRALRGGIDAYSAEEDSSLPRYRVELED